MKTRDSKNFALLTLALLFSFAAAVRAAPGGRVVAWGDNSQGQTDVPLGLTNAVAVAGGYRHSLALQADGTVVTWGDNSYGQTNIPAGLTNVVSIACGSDHNVALKGDGTVVAWGDPTFGQPNVPPGLSNVVAIAASWYWSTALKSDGSLISWGINQEGESYVPPSATNIIAVSGGYQNIWLTGDGSVLYWPGWSGLSYRLSTTLGNVVALAKDGPALLRADGAAEGGPPGVSNLVAVAAYTMGLKSDGTVLIWNNDGSIRTDTPNLTNVIALAGGAAHALAIVATELPLRFLSQPPLQTPYSGADFGLYAAAEGPGTLKYQWRFNGTNISGATNATLMLTNVQPVKDGDYCVVVSNATGSIVSSNTALKTLICAPIIVSQSPQDQLALLGTNILLTATATGPLPIRYQWQFNGTNISGATNAFLGVTNFQVANEGAYTVIVSNNFFATTSAPMSLTAGDLPGALNARYLDWGTSGSAAWFWQSGRSHDGVAVARSGPLAVGKSSTLSTTVTGPGTLTFWWGVYSSVFDDLIFYINGVQSASIYDGDPYNNQVWQQLTFYLPDGTQQLDWTFLRNSSQTFGSRCGFLDEVSYIAGPTAPIFTTSPAEQSVPATGTASFTVAATGTPPLSYQWQHSGTNIADATNTALTVGNLQAPDAGPYTAVVSSPYGTNSSSALLTVIPVPPNLISQPLSQRVPFGGNATFTVSATGSTPIYYQWQHDGVDIPGATASVLSLTGVQAIDAGRYRAVVTNDYGSTNSSEAILTLSRLVGWGDNARGQTAIPAFLTNAVALAAGGHHSLALREDGRIVAWGSNPYGETNVPDSLSNVIAIAAGYNHSLALRSDGTVVAWGAGTNFTPVPPTAGQSRVPLNATNITAIAAGGYHSMALTTNGNVLAWGYNGYGQTNVPPTASNIVAISGGGYHTLALRNDGSVIAWGAGTNISISGYPRLGQSKVPPNLSNVVAIAAGAYHSAALLSNGTVSVWGDRMYGQTNVPAGLSNVVAIACGFYHTLALQSDGTLVAWGDNGAGQSTIAPGLTHVTIMSCGSTFNLAQVNDGSPFIVRQPYNQTLYAGANLFLSVGAVGISPLVYQWQFNGTNIDSATNAWLTLTNLPITRAGNYRCVVANTSATAVSSPSTVSVLRPSLRFSPGAAQLTSAGFAVRLEGLSGQGNIILYASTNLTDWFPAVSNPPAAGSLILLDPSATNSPTRFYRAAEPN